MKIEFSSQSRRENLGARLRNGFVLDYNMATAMAPKNVQTSNIVEKHGTY